ncbi:MAG: hypothetical protein AAB602_00830 [Patescibacteria group bacterium]
MKLRKNNSALTLIEILILIAIIALVAMIVIPEINRNRRALASRQACVANLEQLKQAKSTWATDNNATNGALIVWNDLVLSDGKRAYIAEKPQCPAYGTYVLGNIGDLPQCSLGTKFGHVLADKK